MVVRYIIQKGLFPVLILKRVFRLTLRAVQDFIDTIFIMMKLPLCCPGYFCVSRRPKSVNSPVPSTRGEIALRIVDSNEIKVFGEGKWKIKTLTGKAPHLLETSSGAGRG